ncbi:group II intron reverse transcriptase/maturase [Bacteroides thetaiotaomicron]|uniref:group II intron reverse transcriptase/maturase n=1 Tax=Bacteroides thetaiotaomicron TaxID=818 RepID=UPI0039C13436
MKDAKSFEISKQLVMEAYKRVKANRGTSGIDDVTIADFESNLKGNLYKIWNRMCSGSYLPPAVKLVEIPKSNGGKRPLGIPTVGDRVAQMVVVMTIEPDIEPHFHEDSYAYRPKKSALDAVEKAKDRCYTFHWVLDLDIKGFFDNIDHELLIKALERHVKCKWAMMYIKRWLTVPYQLKDGTQVERTKGVPQGSVIGPILANLFLHYTFDEWMRRNHSNISFERYADDTICHCVSQKQAEFIHRAIKKRFAECKLELNEEKTKIVYCKRNHRNIEYECIQFDFLGYTFKPRRSIDTHGEVFLNFSPAVSKKARTKIWETVRDWNQKYWVQMKLEDIAKQINPVIQGWINYYGKFNPGVLKEVLKRINLKLSRWIRDKFKGFRKFKTQAIHRLGDIALKNPDLFAHWSWGVKPTASPRNRVRVQVAE